MGLQYAGSGAGVGGAGRNSAAVYVMALMVNSREKGQKLVTDFGRMCERMKLKVDVSKRKVMRCSMG